jgi:hypothetical protein
MRGKAHLLCSSLSNFAPEEPKLSCLIRLQGYVVVGNPASPKSRKSYDLSFCAICFAAKCKYWRSEQLRNDKK